MSVDVGGEVPVRIAVRDGLELTAMGEETIRRRAAQLGALFAGLSMEVRVTAAHRRPDGRPAQVEAVVECRAPGAELVAREAREGPALEAVQAALAVVDRQARELHRRQTARGAGEPRA